MLTSAISNSMLFSSLAHVSIYNKIIAHSPNP